MVFCCGGVGVAVVIFVVFELVPSGTLFVVLRLGVLVLEDSGEKDSKIIVVPIDESLRIMRTHSYESFHSEFFEAKQLIQSWFLGYKEGSVIKFISWEDEKAAKIEIEKWSIKK